MVILVFLFWYSEDCTEFQISLILPSFAFILPEIVIIFKYLIVRGTYLAAHFNQDIIVIFSTTEPLSDWPGFRLSYFCCKIPSLARIRFHEIKMKTRIDISEKIVIMTLPSFSSTSFNVWNSETKENTISLLKWKFVGSNKRGNDSK